MIFPMNFDYIEIFLYTHSYKYFNRTIVSQNAINEISIYNFWCAKNGIFYKMKKDPRISHESFSILVFLQNLFIFYSDFALICDTVRFYSNGNFSCFLCLDHTLGRYGCDLSIRRFVSYFSNASLYA